MRFYISLPQKYVDTLRQLAWTEDRTPRQQAEWLLKRLLEEAFHQNTQATARGDANEVS